MVRRGPLVVPAIDDLKDPRNDARDFAVAAARLAHDDRIEDIVIVDLRGLSSVADYFVLGTGTSERQMSAMIEHLRLFAKELGRRPLGMSDSHSGTWLLADYVDVVVHLFDKQHRTYYDLDGLWGDAPRVVWQTNASGETDPESAA